MHGSAMALSVWQTPGRGIFICLNVAIDEWLLPQEPRSLLLGLNPGQLLALVFSSLSPQPLTCTAAFSSLTCLVE